MSTGLKRVDGVLYAALWCVDVTFQKRRAQSDGMKGSYGRRHGAWAIEQGACFGKIGKFGNQRTAQQLSDILSGLAYIFFVAWAYLWVGWAERGFVGFIQTHVFEKLVQGLVF